MERLPKDVLGLIFAQCRPLELVRLAGTCQWFRRCVLLRACARTSVVSCPPAMSIVCEAVVGPRWSEMHECYMRCKGVTQDEVGAQILRAVARATVRSGAEPEFARLQYDDRLDIEPKRYTKRWFLFRLGVLFMASYAAPHQLPLSWERGKRGHRFSVLGRAAHVTCEKVMQVSCVAADMVAFADICLFSFPLVTTAHWGSRIGSLALARSLATISSKFCSDSRAAGRCKFLSRALSPNAF
jgi:hypothetical protein